MYGNDDDIPAWPALLLVIVLAVGVPFACNKIDAERERICGETTVVSVGGCDDHGSCGVKLSDGTFTTMTRPTVGEKCQ